jgi:hypothetical protein
LCQREQGGSSEGGEGHFRFHLVFLLKSCRWVKLDCIIGARSSVRLCEIGGIILLRVFTVEAFALGIAEVLMSRGAANPD